MRAKGEPMSDWLVVELSVGLVGFTLFWDGFWLKKVIGWFLVKINLVQALFIKAPKIYNIILTHHMHSKQNITHEVQSLVVVVNQDSTQEQSELRNLIPLLIPIFISKGYSPKERAFIPYFLAPWMSWRRMVERILQVLKIENL